MQIFVDKPFEPRLIYCSQGCLHMKSDERKGERGRGGGEMEHHLTSVVPFSVDNTPRYRVKDKHNNDVYTSYIVYIEMHTQPHV